MKRIFLLCWLSLCLSSLFSAGKERNVLILSSYHEGYLWEDQIVQGMVSKIEESSFDLKIYHEQLDVMRIPFDKEDFADFFKKKYASVYFDLIMTADDAAYSFVKNYYDDMFLGKPVVFCGVNNYSEREIQENIMNATGINEKINVLETTQTLLKLLPDTKKIYVYGDGSQLYQINKAILIKDLESVDKKIKIYFTDSFNIDQLCEHAKKLDKQSAIFIISPLFDKYKKTITPIQKAGEMISKNTDVPIISFWDFWLGSGILGGKLVSSRAQGEKAGEIAFRILNGETTRTIPIVTESPNEYMFDYHQLKKYNISLRDLPKGSKIINKPVYAYQINRLWLWFFIMVFSVVLGSLILVLFEIKKRIRLEVINKEHILFLKTFIETIPIPVFYKDAENRFKLCNLAFENLLGIDKEKVIGHYSQDFQHYKDTEKHLCYDQKLIEGELDAVHYEALIIDAHGFEKNILVSKASVSDLDKHITGIIGAVQDVTEIKRQEKLIKHQMQELKIKNNEMESFIYTVSHDLKSPLITIKGFMNFIERDYANNDPEQFAGDCKKVMGAAEKMQYLLEDLLQLSRIGRVVREPEEFRMDEVLNELENSLAGIINNSNATLDYPNAMPAIYADKNRIREVWQNLIENSIKYRKEKVSPYIKISYEKKENNIIYSYKDNGIGIDPKYHEKIFDLFEKLNQNTPGTGIGLARVKKIVELYQGKIWVEQSTLNQGTVFKFFFRSQRGKK